MTTLFSPVGTADPFTQLGDGPMLHIIRHRQPSKVVLYLSPAMTAYQHKDQRYTKAIDFLSESAGTPLPEVRIIESDYDEVYRFDLYIEEFESILKELSVFDESVLVNVSSGTAGMAQALVALGSFGRINLELLQVLTPRRGINARHDRENPDEYDFDVLWEWNCDIEQNSDSRIVSVKTPNFSEKLLKESVITLITSYEYGAAGELVNKMTLVSEEATQMINAAASRLNLDGGAPVRVFGGTDLAYRTNDLLLEYLYVMEVRFAQGHWAEFMRSLSPALTELMKRKLQPYLPETAYTLFKNSKPTQKYNVEAINADPRLDSTLRSSHYKNKNAYITNAAYARLIEEYCNDACVVEDIKRLRHAERISRNPLSHTLRASSRKMIEKECGLSLDDIMKTLFDLHGSAKPGLYSRINQAIIASL